MKYTISPDRQTLTLTADAGERANLRDLGESIHQDATLHDMLEHITCNSDLEWVYPDETGDLTDAPMLGILGEEGVKDITVFLPNHGLRETARDGRNTYARPILERWGFMSYAVRSLLQDLRDTGEARLVAGN